MLTVISILDSVNLYRAHFVHNHGFILPSDDTA